MKTKRTGAILIIILVAFTFTVAADEGIPWLGFVPYMITGGPCDNQKPIAAIRVDKTSGNAPLEVSFDASNSYDPDGHVVSYKWEFGDGSTGSAKKVDHTYKKPGVYEVTLTVIDDGGSKDSDKLKIRVKVAPKPNKDPVAKIRSPNDGAEFKVNQSITFDGSASYDPDGKIVSYKWVFNDGTTKYGKIVNHSYSVPHKFSVLLTVTDDDGAKKSDAIDIDVVKPIVKEANLSLNRGQDVYCQEGGIKNVPLFLEGWGNRVRVVILYDPDVVQCGGIYQLGNWKIESIDYNPGRIEAVFSSKLTRPERNRVTKITEVNLHCNPTTQDRESDLDIKNASIHSEGDIVNILSLIDTKIIVQ